MIFRVYRIHKEFQELKQCVHANLADHSIAKTEGGWSLKTNRSGANRSDSGYGGIFYIDLRRMPDGWLEGRLAFRGGIIFPLLIVLWVFLVLLSFGHHEMSGLVILGFLSAFFLWAFIRDYSLYTKFLRSLSS